MSILNVEHLTHGFGDRAIFDDVSFRLLKGEHIGLVGANGEGKSTFMSIVYRETYAGRGKGGMGEECTSRLSGPACSPSERYDDPGCTEKCV